MRGIIVLLVLQLTFNLSASANRDSIGVKQVNNKWFIVHKVDKGMGIYTIAKRYGVSMQQITDNNPSVASGVHPGELLLIPYNKTVTAAVEKPATTPVKEESKTVQAPVSTPAPKSNGREPHFYTVEAGETLYRVSVKFRVSVDNLKKWNGLADNNISAGQKLIVGYTVGADKSETATKPDIQNTSSPALASTEKGTIPDVSKPTPDGDEHIDPGFQKEYDDYQKKLELNKKKGKTVTKMVEESEVATAIDDGSIVSEKNLALHRIAPPGTIIKLTNPMNGNYVFVKVVGSLPKDITEQNVNIKITKTAADKLGVKDKYFRVESHYSMEVIKK